MVIADYPRAVIMCRGQQFIEKRPCNVIIHQGSRDDFTIHVEILVLDAEHGEAPHVHRITVQQADFLSVIRIHEPHPEDLLSEGNEVRCCVWQPLVTFPHSHADNVRFRTRSTKEQRR